MFLIRESTCFGHVNCFDGPEIVDIGVTVTDCIALIKVAGELDLSNSSWLFECLHDAMDAGVTDIVVDLEHVTYMDSTGLVVLLGAQRRMIAAGGTIALLAPTPMVAKLFAVSGSASELPRIIHVTESVPSGPSPQPVNSGA
jgi:anti-sigma B factor antagonist